MVIGNAGGGKSTLARRLAAEMDLPLLSVDQIMWAPGWQRVPEDQYQKCHAEWLRQERWLIDGVGSWPTIKARLAAADTIIFVDLPFVQHLFWASKRQIASLIWGRQDGPKNSPMWRVTLPLFRMMFWLHHHLRPDLIASIQAESTRARVIVIRSKSQLRSLSAGDITGRGRISATDGACGGTELRNAKGTERG